MWCMTSPIEATSIEIPVVKAKRGRKPKNAAPAIAEASTVPMKSVKRAKKPNTVKPNPTIMALEGEILELVRRRNAANAAISSAKYAAETANVQLRMANDQMISVEKEVQYRLGLIGQLRGDAPRTQATHATIYPPAGTGYVDYEASGMGVSIPAGVGSIPSMSSVATINEGGRRVRSESAEGLRSVI